MRGFLGKAGRATGTAGAEVPGQDRPRRAEHTESRRRGAHGQETPEGLSSWGLAHSRGSG